jgi:hypothetical protein
MKEENKNKVIGTIDKMLQEKLSIGVDSLRARLLAEGCIEVSFSNEVLASIIAEHITNIAIQRVFIQKNIIIKKNGNK